MEKFTVIIPIYNAEKYIAEAIESVIGQTIGFTENIHMALVNDGSTDSSELICQKYVAQYPENIEYLYQENKGVAKARNLGLTRVRGKYVNLLDADDKWTPDAFEKAYKYFEENYDEIDVVSCRVKIFDKADSYHFLDYKYTEDKIVDITKDYKYPQMFCNSVFIKAEAIGDTNFRVPTSVSQDIHFINEMILKKGKYAILRSVEYLYRKSGNLTSSIDRKYSKHDFYIAVPRDVYGGIFKMSEEKYGDIIPYCQYLVANDIRTKLIHDKLQPDCLKEGEWEQFLELLHGLYDRIEEKYILALKKVSMSEKVKCLIFKSGLNYDHEAVARKLRVHIDIMNARDGKIYIEGKSRIELLGDTYEIFAEDNKGNRYDVENIPAPVFDVYDVEGKAVLHGTTFSLELPLSENTEYTFIIRDKSTGNTRKAGVDFGLYSRISPWEKSFFCENGRLVYAEKKTIIVKKKLLNYREKNKQLEEELKTIGREDLLEIRRHAEKLRKGKPIWLLQDRGDRAGDNAEALFKYLTATEANKKYRIVFSVLEKSDDYRRMQQYGETVPYESSEYKALFLASDKFISSHWSLVSDVNPTLNPFREDRKYVQDMIKHDFVFLQHGVTKDDLSKFGHKHLRNIKRLVTAANFEYRSFIEGNYGYSEEEVVLTGFPRFDYLNSNPEKLLLIMPTWRNGLEGLDQDSFKSTEFCQFYSRLISDERLIGCMKEKGYKGLFVIHPVFFANHLNLVFSENDTIRVENASVSYNELFNRGSLMLTDYSSVAMDFAYLKKPVVYSQFDRTSFYKGHTYKEGYFSYENDGFGPVCTDYETTIKELIACIDNNCRMDEKYCDRVDSFYKYTDKGNCKRVYEEIQALG